jgi:predicted metalloprotease with PDZ domain
MKPRAFFLILFFSACIHIHGQSILYSVDYKQSVGKAFVVGEFRGFATLNVSMFVHAVKDVPQGEAEFIENLSAKNSTGQALSVKYNGDGEWNIAGKQTESFTISYYVNLQHDKFEWFEAGGVDEVSYATPEGFFATGYSLFIFPSVDDLSSVKDVKVSFKLPGNWKASTPWQSLGNNTYKAASDLRFLLNNCLFVGSHKEETINIEGFELRIAYNSSYEPSKALFMDLMTATLSECKHMFYGSMAKQYLIVINPHRMTDGSAFRGSFSQIINGPMNEISRVTWGHTMIHETMHLWNGHSLRPEGQEEWFKEGFTDYLTVLTESRLGLFSQEIVMNRLEKIYSRYVIGKMIQQAPESLQEAGNRKQEIRSLVYGGGTMFALALDVEMRTATNNKIGVDHLMQTLFEQYAKAGRTYTHADILLTVNKLTQQDLTSFFNNFLYTKSFVNYVPYFEKLGLNAYPFAEELYLSKDRDNEMRKLFWDGDGIRILCGFVR